MQCLYNLSDSLDFANQFTICHHIRFLINFEDTNQFFEYINN